jgi:NAD(P)H dehydrogenase (quinone)
LRCSFARIDRQLVAAKILENYVMTLIITGASGQFGRATVEGLLKSVPAQDLILLTRTPAKLADLAALGCQVRQGDYDDTQSMRAAFAGGNKMLMISAVKVGFRIPQHRRAIEAAVAAGVGQIVYTSFIGFEGADTSLAVSDHRATEAMLFASGADWTILRNSQYIDAVIEAQAPHALRSGHWLASAAEGKLAQVAREDCVRSAIAVMADDGHRNVTYNITGPDLLSFREIAAIIADVAESNIEYNVVDDDGMYAFFDSLGVPREAVPDQVVNAIPWSSDDMVSFERAIREGHFAVISHDVEKLTGRLPMSIREFALARKATLVAAGKA